MKFRRLALCVLELEGRSDPLGNFRPFSKVDGFGAYYDACKILIADVKCTMRTSSLLNFMSLGDLGDPTEPLIFFVRGVGLAQLKHLKLARSVFSLS